MPLALSKSLAMQALAWLLSVSGASRTVLDARVTYAPAAMAELLGAAPATHASAATVTAAADAFGVSAR